MTSSVSVIMPVYNSDAYLDDAMRSVLRQRGVDFELICVDDGSTDESHAILERWGATDPRVVVLTQPNRGQGVARNRGLDVARGNIVYFMDSDDILDGGALSKSVSRMDADELDLLLFEGRTLVDDGCEHDEGMYRRSRDYPGVWSGAELYLKQSPNRDFIVQPCMSAARKTYLRRFDVRFAEGVIHEDEQYSFFALVLARRVGVLRERMYVRRYRPESTMTALDIRDSIVGYLTVLAGLNSCNPVGEARCRAVDDRVKALRKTCAGLASRMGLSSDRTYELCKGIIGDELCAKAIATDPRIRFRLLFSAWRQFRAFGRRLRGERRRNSD